jgi:SP family sugar:H+ symporter-like MFS transporter
MTAAYQLFVTLGILISYCVNLGTSNLHDSAQWRAPIAIMYGWNSILLFGMFFLPESPRWLLSNGKQQECLSALEFIAGKNGDKVAIEEEYQEIETRVQEDAQIGKASLFAAFNPNGKALYRMLLGFLLQMGQQLTGAK